MKKMRMRRIYEMSFTDVEKKQLKIFVAVAFGLPVLMGILMGIGYYQGSDVSAFPTAQMFYPAAGVMLALLFTRDKEKPFPRKFYYTFLAATVLQMVCAIASIFTPQLGWAVICQIPLMILSVICLIMLLVEKKETRALYGIRLTGRKGAKSGLYILLFFALYLLRFFIGMAFDGQVNVFVEMFASLDTWIMIGAVALNFFFAFTAFFGEEYGWRYFFQPLLQKRFGKKAGVLFLGVVWGLWHLPINIFYYSPDTWHISVILQIVTCVSYSIFFGYGYLKTENIWVPVVMHYINNNMAAVVGGGASAIENNVYRWVDVPVLIGLNMIFMVFIYSKVYREKKENV